jgi:hypothetical protein
MKVEITDKIVKKGWEIDVFFNRVDLLFKLKGGQIRFNYCEFPFQVTDEDGRVFIVGGSMEEIKKTYDELVTLLNKKEEQLRKTLKEVERF